MSINFIYPEYEVVRNEKRCIKCRACERQCANEVHSYDQEFDCMEAQESQCVDCQRCVTLCPTNALKIVKTNNRYRENANWQQQTMEEIFRQADTGGVLLSSMGTPKDYPNYFDKILINASQVTNPPIDPLREPMESKVFLGKKLNKLEFDENDELLSEIPPQIELEMPIMFSAMSYGSISENAHKSLARAATELGICYNTGEGGLNQDLYQYGANTIVQVASGRFGVHRDYLNAGAAIEIKMGQGAKPGIGGHLPGKKIQEKVSRTRMIPVGVDAISPAPHHDIYSIEDLRQLIFSLKEATNYKKPVIVKIAAVHNVAAIASGIARSGADIISIDGFRGGTGAAPTRIRDNVGIPIELALAAVDQRLRDEKIRNDVSIVVGGSIRNSADVVKAIALGADAVYIGTAALLALGCHLCRTCHTGKCNWGIATQREDLVKRLNPDIGSRRLVNLVSAWNHEIMEMMGGMGINSIEALKGNRLMLRGIGMSAKELEIFGIAHAGE
ncbi:glutamate synthase-related protein [Acetobacterium bakii]|uniref:glutamate synthase (NADPH) n=1 Tax=Acetobacterium bakii TaxID=52689 RepID=A0A0L6U3N2_9FIRM|nr:glutamate synthase-related protein [Acetobacterium bakii]KNZ43134.1 glutamate synthase [Acetobacterium bakii]